MTSQVEVRAVTTTSTPAPTTTPRATATRPPAPSPTATSTPRPAQLVSEVAPAVRPPTSAVSTLPARGDVTQLSLPPGTRVVWGGCASDRTCYRYNFYWAPTREAVLQQNEPAIKVQHELCHAHQHWSINGGAALAPEEYDLKRWYETPEGRSFVEATRGLPWPWTQSAVNGIEDFAWTCAYWYVDPDYLRRVSPERYRWAQEHLP